jgi:ABC-type hemin transport system substrate-binding protein
LLGSGQTQTIELLRQFGIAVYVMESGTYQQVKEELSEIAVLSGAQKRAQEILNFLMKLAESQPKQHVSQISNRFIMRGQVGEFFLPRDVSRLPMTLLSWQVLTTLFRPMPINPM